MASLVVQRVALTIWGCPEVDFRQAKAPDTPAMEETQALCSLQAAFAVYLASSHVGSLDCFAEAATPAVNAGVPCERMWSAATAAIAEVVAAGQMTTAAAVEAAADVDVAAVGVAGAGFVVAPAGHAAVATDVPLTLLEQELTAALSPSPVAGYTGSKAYNLANCLYLTTGPSPHLARSSVEAPHSAEVAAEWAAVPLVLRCLQAESLSWQAQCSGQSAVGASEHR